MAGSVNKVILVGNLGKDPEIRTLESGAVVAKFPLATSESFRNKNNEKVEQTEWHNIVMWRGLAEIAEKYLRKGSKVYIEGKIRTRSYEDKDRNKRYVTEIEADNLLMLDGKAERTEFTPPAESFAPQPNTSSKPDSSIDTRALSDDLPF